jgi:hypothetical protein
MDSSLARKLQLKPGQRLLVINPPKGYVDQLATALDGIDVVIRAPSRSDAVLVFVNNLAETNRLTPKGIRSVKPEGLFWIAYPKGSAKVKTDVNRDRLWQTVEPFGWGGVRLIAMDEVWSAMRFRPGEQTRRKK